MVSLCYGCPLRDDRHLVAQVEHSVPRERIDDSPDFAALHPGYVLRADPLYRTGHESERQ